MRRRQALAQLGSALGAGALPAWASVGGARPPHIAVWGDSITDLYQWNLARAYEGQRQVFNGGVPREVSQQIRARMVADRDHKDWITVLWYGHNNWVKSEVGVDVAASVASLPRGHDRFVVLSMLTWANDGLRGSPAYKETLKVNAELGVRYPKNYLDIRAHLVGLYNRQDPRDVRDFRNDITPSSLRFDDIHLNTAGCNAVVARLQQFIADKGW